jgi:hypothetical protein
MPDVGTTPVADRLKRGAAMLGELWRKGIRCSEEWSVLCPDADPTLIAECFCETKTTFCHAKIQWLKLAMDSGREIVDGEFGLILAMNGSEWDASGLTVKFDIPGVGIHGIGPAGVMGRQDILKLCEAPDTLGSILNMMKSFPGMKVEEIISNENKPTVKVSEEDFWDT